MKKYIAATLILITLIVGGLSVQSQPQAAKQWEYKVEHGITEKKINELGLQGWELATASQQSTIPVLIFKREKK